MKRKGKHVNEIAELFQICFDQRETVVMDNSWTKEEGNTFWQLHQESFSEFSLDLKEGNFDGGKKRKCILAIELWIVSDSLGDLKKRNFGRQILGSKEDEVFVLAMKLGFV